MDVEAPEDVPVPVPARRRSSPRNDIQVFVGAEFHLPGNPTAYQVARISDNEVMYCDIIDDRETAVLLGPLGLEAVRGMLLEQRRRGG